MYALLVPFAFFRLPLVVRMAPWNPNLSSPDYAVWNKLKADICAIRHHNIGSNKATLLQAHANLSSESMRAACKFLKVRLRACIVPEATISSNFFFL